MKYTITILLISMHICISSTILAQTQKNFKPDTSLVLTINNALNQAVSQYKVLAKNLPSGVLPKTFLGNKKLETSSSSWWTSGFYSGSLFYLYEYSKDTVLLQEALNREKLLEREKNNKNTHDLGFMMFCSFGNANKLIPSKEYESILLTSANSLSTRFNAKVGCIKSWDHGNWKYPVIIDNMMNLELLFWATKVSGDSSYYKIAVTHANTTMKNHYRDDHSSFHVVDYDPNTGNVISKKTAQGYADGSAWARGQSWGLYGFTLMYRFTKDKTYLNFANQIAHYIIDNPNLPADKIPYWDFNTIDIPATYRDASAGAIAASALIELSSYTDSKNKLLYLKTSEKIIKALASSVYTAKLGENGGFILKHSVGNWPGYSEIDVPLTYADYYFIEAMIRYKKLVK